MYAAGTIYALIITIPMSSLMKRPQEGIIMYLDCMCPAKAFDGTAAINGPPRQAHGPVMYAAGTIYALIITIPMSDLMKRPLEGIIMYLDCMCPAEALDGTAPSTGPPRQPRWPVMYAAGTIYTLRNTKSISSLLKRPLEGVIMY
jgi:hypothetical protein